MGEIKKQGWVWFKPKDADGIRTLRGVLGWKTSFSNRSQVRMERLPDIKEINISFIPFFLRKINRSAPGMATVVKFSLAKMQKKNKIPANTA